MAQFSSSCLPVAVDVMGGDYAPDVLVEGALIAHREGLPVVLVGDQVRVRALIGERNGPMVVHAPHAIAMTDPATSVRRHIGASVRVAVRLVAEGRACGAVSFGHSGALLVSCVLELQPLPDVLRPAIALTLPRRDGGRLVVLDAGASADCRADHLLTYGLLGTAYARVLGVERPRVGLLSNGAEPGKGNRLSREAHGLLQASCPGFLGNVEPDAALRGDCDVLVSDGFTGNVLLKTAEGVVGLVSDELRRSIGTSWRARLGAWLLKPALKDLRADLDWRNRGGALMLGLPAPIVVGHGRADATAVRAAVQLAHYASDRCLIGEIRSALGVDVTSEAAAVASGESG